jgi:hypothetical protein
MFYYLELTNVPLIDYSRVTDLDFDLIATPEDMILLRNPLMIPILCPDCFCYTQCICTVPPWFCHDYTDPVPPVALSI